MLLGALGDYGATADLETFTTRYGRSFIHLHRTLHALLGSALYQSQRSKVAAEAGCPCSSESAAAIPSTPDSTMETPSITLRSSRSGLSATSAPMSPTWTVGHGGESARSRFKRTLPSRIRPSGKSFGIREIAGPAVLAWIVAGCLAGQSEGLGDSSHCGGGRHTRLPGVHESSERMARGADRHHETSGRLSRHSSLTTESWADRAQVFGSHSGARNSPPS